MDGITVKVLVWFVVGVYRYWRQQYGSLNINGTRHFTFAVVAGYHTSLAAAECSIITTMKNGHHVHITVRHAGDTLSQALAWFGSLNARRQGANSVTLITVDIATLHEERTWLMITTRHG